MERDELRRIPEYVEPEHSKPAPQRVRCWTGSIRAKPQSSLERQPLERPDASGPVPAGETPATSDGLGDWPDRPILDADQCVGESLSLPVASYPKDPMVIDPCPEDTTLTQGESCDVCLPTITVPELHEFQSNRRLSSL